MSDFRLRNLEASQFRKCVFYLALFTRLGAPGIGERTACCLKKSGTRRVALITPPIPLKGKLACTPAGRN